MGHPKVTIHNVEAEQVAQMKEFLREHHDITIEHNTFDGGGVRATLTYDEAAETLTVDLLHHPAIVTPGYLLGFLYDHLAAGLPADANA